MSRMLLLLYLLLSLLNLYAEQQRVELLLLTTKPLLITVLSLWFYLQLRPLRSRDVRFILAGLIFSIGGDTLLMLVGNGPKNENFFLLGLGSFLLAQLFYTLGYLFFPGAKNGAIIQKPWRVWPFLLYLIISPGGVPLCRRMSQNVPVWLMHLLYLCKYQLKDSCEPLTPGGIQ